MQRLIHLLFTRQPQRLPNEESSEHGQTRVRLTLLVVVAIYVALIGRTLAGDEPIAQWAVTILIYYICYAPAALAIYLWAHKRPGHYPIRRLASMTLDYFSVGFSIVVEPMVMMPLHIIILWITLGNGLRYGKTYLWIATGYAIVTISTVGYLTPLNENTPYMLAMLLLTIVAIPQYASSLLGRIEQARREADEANLAKSRFLAQASHDLRQPLHAINLFTTSLQETGLNKPQRQIVERIDRALQSVARLFRSLLDISTLDSGTIIPRPEPAALGDVFQEVFQQNIHLAEWDNSELRVIDTKIIVMTDRALLLTMIQNLVSNAIKFSPGRGVLLGCRRRGSHIAIEVWDQGVGIAEAHFAHLFDEFYQIKERGDRDRQGVGLGLAIVSRMAKLLDLKIAVASRIGKGSRFTIEGLTLAPQQMAPMVKPPIGNKQQPLRGMTILLVEDDIDVLEATAGLLSSWGCLVIATPAIPETIQPCDLIITDFDLGGDKTGGDCINIVCEALGSTIPAIVITGHDENRIVAEINDPEILVLKKPLHPAELRSTIGSMRAELGLVQKKSPQHPNSQGFSL